MDIGRRLAVWGWGMAIALAFAVGIVILGAALTGWMILVVLLVAAGCIWLNTKNINRRYAAREAARQVRR